MAPVFSFLEKWKIELAEGAIIVAAVVIQWVVRDLNVSLVVPYRGILWCVLRPAWRAYTEYCERRYGKRRAPKRIKRQLVYFSYLVTFAAAVASPFVDQYFKGHSEHSAALACLCAATVLLYLYSLNLMIFGDVLVIAASFCATVLLPMERQTTKTIAVQGIALGLKLLAAGYKDVKKRLAAAALAANQAAAAAPKMDPQLAAILKKPFPERGAVPNLAASTAAVATAEKMDPQLAAILQKPFPENPLFREDPMQALYL
ncbi:unnamed protein product [Cuscuta campestris]|uniref:Uncharacterized protein n=1 Tax=Cuscuta campestris TaxID=132261 RepID=A0A484JZY0_9ASTE|nr:unnamed protein product [Cuscuta campestris]